MLEKRPLNIPPNSWRKSKVAPNNDQGEVVPPSSILLQFIFLTIHYLTDCVQSCSPGCANMPSHEGATWRIRLNLCFLRPSRVHNPNRKSIGSAIFAQLTAECRRACPGIAFPPTIAHSHGESGPHVIMISRCKKRVLGILAISNLQTSEIYWS